MAEPHPIPQNPRFQNITGKTFDRWFVLYYLGKHGPSPYWRCRCSCGRERDVNGDSLKQGNSTCCRTCARRHTLPPAVKHGQCDSPTYSSWKAMCQRCTNPNAPHYADYGGRGITVCQRWRESFEAFLLDMGERPSLSHTIERVKNHLGYEPGNCCWATRAEQMRNTRRNRLLTYEGVTL